MDDGLDKKHRTSAFLTGMRGTQANEGPPGDVLGVVHARRQGLALPARDGARRVGSLGCMDAQNRVHVTEAARAAGWAPECAVVVSVDGGAVRAWPGTPMHPTQSPTRFKAGRLTLPRPVRAVLGLVAGDQVMVASEPGTGALVIAAAADVLQALTGPAGPFGQAVAATPVPVRRSGVKAAWRPAEPAAS